MTRLYLDYDHVVPGRMEEDGSPPAEYIDSHKELVQERVEVILKHLGEIEGLLAKGWQGRYVIASRHGWCPSKSAWKVSFRPFVLGIAIPYVDIPTLLRLIRQDDKFWDLSVYKQGEQLLAAINGCKGVGKACNNDFVFDDRLLLPQRDDDAPLLSMELLVVGVCYTSRIESDAVRRRDSFRGDQSGRQASLQRWPSGKPSNAGPPIRVGLRTQPRDSIVNHSLGSSLTPPHGTCSHLEDTNAMGSTIRSSLWILLLALLS
jgi:hypothetical protein